MIHQKLIKHCYLCFFSWLRFNLILRNTSRSLSFIISLFRFVMSCFTMSINRMFRFFMLLNYFFSAFLNYFFLWGLVWMIRLILGILKRSINSFRRCVCIIINLSLIPLVIKLLSINTLFMQRPNRYFSSQFSILI